MLVHMIFFIHFDTSFRTENVPREISVPRDISSNTHIHTYTHKHTKLGQINSLKGSYLKRPKCKPTTIHHILIYSVT